jgi:hypothetical protein
LEIETTDDFGTTIEVRDREVETIVYGKRLVYF